MNSRTHGLDCSVQWRPAQLASIPCSSTQGSKSREDGPWLGQQEGLASRFGFEDLECGVSLSLCFLMVGEHLVCTCWGNQDRKVPGFLFGLRDRENKRYFVHTIYHGPLYFVPFVPANLRQRLV